MDFSEQSRIEDEALRCEVRREALRCEVRREAHFKQSISTIVNYRVFVMTVIVLLH
jgi:hypothetical protein